MVTFILKRCSRNKWTNQGFDYGFQNNQSFRILNKDSCSSQKCYFSVIELWTVLVVRLLVKYHWLLHLSNSTSSMIDWQVFSCRALNFYSCYALLFTIVKLKQRSCSSVSYFIAGSLWGTVLFWVVSVMCFWLVPMECLEVQSIPVRLAVCPQKDRNYPELTANTLRFSLVRGK